MADLQLTFSEVYEQVADFLGLGTSPTGDDLTKVKKIVHRAYRKFLFPVDPKLHRTYIWSFRQQSGKITTLADKWQYELPKGFSKFTSKLTLEEDSTYPNPTYTSENRIMDRRSASDTSGYPRFYALRAATYHREIGQSYEVIFWPKPDAEYVYNYRYLFTPPKLEDDDDYFVGGAEASECILELALAVAEMQEDDTRGIHFEESSRLIHQLMEADKTIAPDTVGINHDPSIVSVWPGIRHDDPNPREVEYN